MITVINVRGKERSGIEYVGRKWAGFERSPLANPFHIGRDGNRDRSIEKYENWLKYQLLFETLQAKEIDRLAEKYVSGKDVILGCWCFPEKCHADIVKKYILERAAEIVDEMANAW